MDRTYIDFVNNTAREVVMRLYGVIGDKVDGDYFAQELASLDSGGLDLVHVRVNSPGGDVFQGMSIVSAMLSMNTPVVVHVDGIAASMAAVITVAADRVCMMDFAKMMIHDPYFSGADAKSLSAKQKKMLARLTDMLRQVLSRRGKDDAEMAKLMQEETWFSAEEARKAGLCDEITVSARNEYKQMAPLQLVAAVEAEYHANNKNNKHMKEVALKLGLPENAGEAEILAAIMRLIDNHATEVAALKTAKATAEAETARLKKEKEDSEKAEAVILVDQAIKDGRITADLREDYLEMFASDFARTQKILTGAAPRTRLSEMAGKPGTGGTNVYASLTWDELDRKGLLTEVREKDPGLYEAKYKEMAAGLNIRK